MCGMLALFAFSQVLPRLPLRIPDRPTASVPAAPLALYEETPEVSRSPSAAPAVTRGSIDWIGLVAYAYCAVALAFLAQFVTGVFLVRKLTVARGHALRPAIHESAIVAVPLTVGWLRPQILLPLEWREWDREKLDAVLAHEGAHVRRRDGLISALAAVNRSIFWFHPLAWMLERKLALLAEQACDEYSVAALGDRERYARLLLEMALVVDGSHGRLHSHALTMAAASHIRQRIESLLQEGQTFSRGLSWTGWAAVMLCGIPLVFGAGAVELDRQPLLKLEMPRLNLPAPPLLARRPVLLAQARPTPPPQGPAPLPAAPTPKFEVASVKPCKEGETVNVSGGTGKKGGGRSGGGGGSQSPDRLDLPCLPLRFFIQMAYIMSANQLNPDGNLRLEGGPAWIDSERYQINAKADGPVGRGMMQGSMLQALLEDRFKLKIHRETRETPLYALTVASGGLKLQRPGDLSCAEPDAGGPDRDGRPAAFLGCSKLQRAEAGSCTSRDLTQFPPPPLQPGDKPPCGVLRGLEGRSTPRHMTDILGTTMAQIARTLEGGAGRPVIDKTGLTEKFDFHIEYVPDGAPPSDDPDALPSVFTALQHLGLKLEPVKGPRDFLVIDHVERPSEN